jgi:hypothetical protein
MRRGLNARTRADSKLREARSRDDLVRMRGLGDGAEVERASNMGAGHVVSREANRLAKTEPIE